MVSESIKKKLSERKPKVYHIGAYSPDSKAVIEKFEQFVKKYAGSRVDLLAVCVRILDELENLNALESIIKGEKRLADIFSSSFKIRTELDKQLKEISLIIENMIKELEDERNLISKSKVIDNLTATLSRLVNLDKVSLEEIDAEIQQIHQDRMKIFKNLLPSYEISERE